MPTDPLGPVLIDPEKCGITAQTAGESATLQSPTETRYVSVALAAGNWLVSVEDEVPQTFSARGRAVVVAHEVAKRVHREAGTPCAVRALLSNGEWSVLTRFDKPDE